MTSSVTGSVWRDRRSSEMRSEAERPMLWRRSDALITGRANAIVYRHVAERSLRMRRQECQISGEVQIWWCVHLQIFKIHDLTHLVNIHDTADSILEDMNRFVFVGLCISFCSHDYELRA